MYLDDNRVTSGERLINIIFETYILRLGYLQPSQ